VSLTEAEGPLPLGPANDIIWFARGRVAVLVPRSADGGVDDAVQQVAERYELVGAKLALAIIIDENTERPGPEMDQRIQRALEDVSSVVLATSITILGTGFFAGFFMSLMSRVLSLVKRNGVKPTLHSTLESAAAWLHEQLNDPDTSLDEILETLRWANANANANAA